MPLSLSSSSIVSGIWPPYSAITWRAIDCKRTARVLYPRGTHAEMTSAVGAAARSASVGKSERNCKYFGSTRSTCVCWSIISDTRIAYGSLVERQGRVRCSAAYHFKRKICTCATRSGASWEEKGEERACLRIKPQDLLF